MRLIIKRIDKSLSLPSYQTKDSVGFDLVSRLTLTIPSFIPTLVPLNVVIKIPKGYMMLLAARSSLALKKNLILANGVGVIDPDYCGEKDEIKASVINFSKKPVIIKKGERIVQGILIKIEKFKSLKEIKKMSEKNRGGFGSTG